jgi:hypothetical protein
VRGSPSGGSGHGSRAPSAPGIRPAAWAGYAAAAWAFAFAALSFYWAAGGTAGGETIGPAITDLGHDPVFVLLLWAIGLLKVLGGLLALALVQPWGRSIPRWLLLALGWGGGGLLALYGGASWVQEVLMVAGVIPIPAGLGPTAAMWHVVLWDPWWLLGGVLFIVAARAYRRGSSGQGTR